MNLYTKQKEAYRHRKQTYSYQRGKGGKGVWINQSMGLTDNKILYIKQINKNLLFSTRNYIHYLVFTTYSGKSQKKIYKTLSLCWTPETNTIL